MPHALLAQLCMHMGDRQAALEHARAALPVMHRLGASDDEIQLRALLVLCAIDAGHLADAEEELGRIDRIDDSAMPFGGAAFREICRAELRIAGGDSAAGLQVYRECAAQMSELEFPGMPRNGQEPWALFGDALSLSAHAWYAAGADEARGQELFSVCQAGALLVLTPDNPRRDYPAFGLLLFALGAWSLLRQAAPADDALRLLALADRFSYSRMIPTMRWERIVPRAEQARPGRLGELQAEYEQRRPSDLLAEARRAAERVPG
jgi:hypothetical protein